MQTLGKFSDLYEGSPTAVFYSLPEYNQVRGELDKFGVSFHTKIIKAKKDKPAAYRIVLIDIAYADENCPHCGDPVVDYMWCRFCGDITALDEYHGS